MFDYLQQFNNLPKDLKDKVSSKEAMSLLAEIESRYRVDLAMIVMKVMIKSLSIKDLPSIFVGEFALTPERAEKMTQELKEKIFILVADYVGLSDERRSLDLSKDMNLLIKEAGLALPSEFLIERLNKILAIYLRGVRNRIDTKASLAKDIAIGGLNLNQLEIDRVLKVCDSYKFKYNGNINLTANSGLTSTASRLDKIVSASEGLAPSTSAGNNIKTSIVEYDLKRALASGETKRIVAPESKIMLADKEAVDKKIADKETAKVMPDKAPLDKKISDNLVPLVNQKPVIHKPENNSFLKKLFVDQNKTPITEKNKTSVLSTPLIPLVPPIAPVVSSVAAAPVAAASLSAVNSPIANTTAARTAPLNPALARKSILSNTTPEGSRPLMHDIKPAPKIMGPLEEIQFLDLINFRRLGKTPEEITTKIFNKIKLLEKDGYEKMIAGIGAWRKSPVSRLYLHIVQEAVISNLPLKEAIEKREKNKQEGLTLAEIEAIMNLNSKLIF